MNPIENFNNLKNRKFKKLINGPGEEYFRSGNLKIKCFLRNSLFHGEYFRYNKNGDLITYRIFDNGILIYEIHNDNITIIEDDKTTIINCIPMSFNYEYIPYEKVYEIIKEIKCIEIKTYVKNKLIKNTFSGFENIDKIESFEKKHNKISFFLLGSQKHGIEETFNSGNKSMTRINKTLGNNDGLYQYYNSISYYNPATKEIENEQLQDKEDVK